MNSFENISDELKKENRWVLCTKDTKKPCQINGYGAASNNPATWTTYEKAINCLNTHKDIYSTIGYELSGSGYTGIDIDHIGEPGKISIEVSNSIIDELDSYTEISQSKEGRHVLVRGTIKEDFKHVIEMYANNHYIALTGDIPKDRPYKKTIEDRQTQINKLYKKYHVIKEKAPDIKNIDPKEIMNCKELLQKAFNSDYNGEHTKALYDGKWEELLDSKGEHYASESEADLALINPLAYWFDKDINTINKIFMQSKHYANKTDDKKKKWARVDYRSSTINKVIKNLTNGSFQEHIKEQNKIIEADIKFEDIIPFDEYSVPDFPSDCFPGWIKNYVDAVAENTQTPKDLSSVIGLSVFASALAGKFKIQGKADWLEPLNLYVAVIMNPAERKSSVFSHMTKPLLEYEAEANLELKPNIAQNTVEREILENSLKNLKTSAAKKNNMEMIEKAKEKAVELEEFTDIKPLRLLADDISPEKVASLLAENNGKIAIMSPEGGIFEIMAGRYSSNGNTNLEVFLKGHCGDTIIVDRVGRDYEHIDDPALTMGLTIQPEVLRGVMNNTSFTGRGLTARFLFSVPQSKVGYRNIKSKAIPTEIKDLYFKNVKTLLNKNLVKTEFTAVGIFGDEIENKEEIHILHLSKPAMEKSFKFAQKLEPRLINDLESIKEWTGKLHGAILRIAGILHCCEYIGSNNVWDINVSEETLDKAIKIGYYFIEHYKAASGLMGGDSDVEKSKFILKFIKKNNLTEFTRRDLQRSSQTKFKKADSINPALEILIENNFIIEKQVSYTGVGRKPQNKYLVNPLYK